MDIILQAVNLKKTYNSGSPLESEALRGVSLDFERGRYYAIVGKSGCGKSTLLNLLGALDTPTEGEVRFGGKDISGFSRAELARLRRKKVGFVFQSYNLLPEHTCRENITMPLDLDGRDPDAEYFERIVGLLEIGHLLDKYPLTLSGGEQQRVAIARALVAKPDIVLADEPTGNLDPVTTEKTLDLLKTAVKEFGQTIVVVTHDMDVAAEAEVVITIHSGEIVGVKDKREHNA